MVYPHVEYHGPAHPDQLQPKTPTVARELDSRISDGIHVRLLWHSADGHVSAAVDDTKAGEAFELRVDDRDRAMEVFHHPFAYAARRDHATESSTSSANRAVAA
jgi:hypothetical protein